MKQQPQKPDCTPQTVFISRHEETLVYPCQGKRETIPLRNGKPIPPARTSAK